VYTVWFAWWLFVGAGVLQVLGQHDLAARLVEWRVLVIPISAGLLHAAHNQDEGPQALALGFLLFIAFEVSKYGPDPADPSCVADDDYSCASGNSLLAVGTAVAALVLTYYRPAVTKLRDRVAHLRWSLYRLVPGMTKELGDDLEEKGSFASMFAAENKAAIERTLASMDETTRLIEKVRGGRREDRAD